MYRKPTGGKTSLHSERKSFEAERNREQVRVKTTFRTQTGLNTAEPILPGSVVASRVDVLDAACCLVREISFL